MNKWNFFEVHAWFNGAPCEPIHRKLAAEWHYLAIHVAASAVLVVGLRSVCQSFALAVAIVAWHSAVVRACFLSLGFVHPSATEGSLKVSAWARAPESGFDRELCVSMFLVANFLRLYYCPWYYFWYSWLSLSWTPNGTGHCLSC